MSEQSPRETAYISDAERSAKFRDLDRASVEMMATGATSVDGRVHPLDLGAAKQRP